MTLAWLEADLVPDLRRPDQNISIRDAPQRKIGLKSILKNSDVHYGTVDGFLRLVSPDTNMKGLDSQACSKQQLTPPVSGCFPGGGHPISGWRFVRLPIRVSVLPGSWRSSRLDASRPSFGLEPSTGRSGLCIWEVVRAASSFKPSFEIVRHADG